MKYICNRCAKVFQADDITIHYTKGSNGLEIVVICPSCLEKYLDKTKVDTDRKEDENERMKMQRKWQ
jgi:DNA-directed RNA polymerase subunit RPC12/RpoP